MQSVQRLYKQFQPERYEIAFDLTDTGHDHRFFVTTTIHGNKTSEAPLRLHAKDLEITQIIVDTEDIFDFTQEGDELVIPTSHIGGITVTIKAKGVATDGMHGIYPCYYEHEGVKKELLATQFESHHAREAFPCVDEPEAKATYDITLVTTPGLTALSNMPAVSSRVIDQKAVTVFQQTPRMSSYLLAFVVGDLQGKTTKTSSGVDVTVYATRAHDPESLTYACQWAARSIDFLEQYFGVPYPLPKCDQVALPDFSASAMENWGLVTYRESALLVDNAQATMETKQRISLVISHEVSHQWFGNLVTMKWWDDLWLNESFANLMEYITCDALEPSWRIWEDFSSKECFLALQRDALDGVQPVKVTINNPDEIGALFDHAIVYAKGSRLLRMLHDYLGDEVFRSGLKAYFSKHSYGNTTENDLWKVLSAASGKDVATFMTTWLTHPGYPVVSFSDSLISQHRFFVGEHSDDVTTWETPLLANVSSFPKVLMEQEVAAKNSFAILNMSDGAHFITHYTDEQYKNVINAASHDALQPIDVLRLLNEQYMLALSGKTSVTQLIDLLQASTPQTSVHVWEASANAIGLLKRLAENSDEARPLLRSFLENLVTEQHARLGWKPAPNEPIDNTRLRPIILSIMGYTQNDRVIRAAHAAFNAEQFANMNPTTRVATTQIIARNGMDDSDFNALLDLYRSSSSPELRQDLAASLSATRAPSQIKTLIDALTDGTIRPQDVRRWLPHLLASPDAREAAWQWIRHKWSWITETFKGDFTYDDFPMFAGRYLGTEQQLDEYREFFKPWRVEPGLVRAIELGEKEIGATVEFIARNHDTLLITLKEKE